MDTSNNYKTQQGAQHHFNIKVNKVSPTQKKGDVDYKAYSSTTNSSEREDDKLCCLMEEDEEDPEKWQPKKPADRHLNREKAMNLTLGLGSSAPTTTKACSVKTLEV